MRIHPEEFEALVEQALVSVVQSRGRDDVREERFHLQVAGGDKAEDQLAV